jgi:hypothetical protein
LIDLGDGAFYLAPKRLVDLTKRDQLAVVMHWGCARHVRNRFDSRQSRFDPADRLHRFFISHAIE